MSLQDRIGAWHVGEFGEQVGHRRMCRKLLEEAAELICAPPEGVAEEAADCLIVLMAIAHRRGFDLLAEAERKFDIVAARGQKAREDSR